MTRSQEIVVLGSVLATEETVEELLAEALVHVRRSRAEPGCLQHGVHRDVEDPLRLVFVERWADRAAIDRHFAVPESATFVAAVGRLSAEPPTMAVYEADRFI